MHGKWYLVWKRIPCLGRCPRFKGSGLEGFHCIEMGSSNRWTHRKLSVLITHKKIVRTISGGLVQ